MLTRYTNSNEEGYKSSRTINIFIFHKFLSLRKPQCLGRMSSFGQWGWVDGWWVMCDGGGVFWQCCGSTVCPIQHHLEWRWNKSSRNEAGAHGKTHDCNTDISSASWRFSPRVLFCFVSIDLFIFLFCFFFAPHF